MADRYTQLTLATGAYTNTANWVGGSAPAANDNIFMQFNNAVPLIGSDQGATELDDVHVLPACTGQIGTEDTYLQLDQGTTNQVVYAGRGLGYLDMGDAGGALLRVDQTAAGRDGKAGLYFRCDTNPYTLAEIRGGDVEFSPAVATTANVRRTATLILQAASTVTTVNVDGGALISNGAALTTVNLSSGNATINGSDAYTANVFGGALVSNSTGALTCNMYGGILDLSQLKTARAVTLNYWGGTVIGLNNATLTLTLNGGARLVTA
jgi:hypothetical protein